MPTDSTLPGGSEPRRSRPHMPQYGISEDTRGMFTWDWVDEQAAQARNYWICTTRPNGRPHAAPVWGVWLDGTLIFGCARGSRKARNLAANPSLVVHLESGDDVVIFEGTAEEVTDPARLARMAEGYATKYPPFRPDPAAEPDTVYYALKIHTAFAWQERDFTNSATRWQVGDG